MKKKKALQVDIDKDVSEEDKIKFKKLIESINRASLQSGKVMYIYVSFSAKGECSVINFGCAPKLQEKANFIGTQIGDMIPEIITAYEMPDIDIPKEPVQS